MRCKLVYEPPSLYLCGLTEFGRENNLTAQEYCSICTPIMADAARTKRHALKLVDADAAAVVACMKKCKEKKK